MFMAERNGLGARVVDFRDVRRLIDYAHSISEQRNQDDRAINAHAGYRIRAAVKNLSHTRIPRNTLRGEQPGRDLAPLCGPLTAASICGKRRPLRQKGGTTRQY